MFLLLMIMIINSYGNRCKGLINGNFVESLTNGWVVDSTTMGEPKIVHDYLQIGDINQDTIVNGTSSIYQEFIFTGCNNRLTFDISGATSDKIKGDFHAVYIRDVNNIILATLTKTLFGFKMGNHQLPWIFETHNLCEYGLRYKIGSPLRVQFLVQGNGNGKGTFMVINNVCFQ
jgi:hypothetical protein